MYHFATADPLHCPLGITPGACAFAPAGGFAAGSALAGGRRGLAGASTATCCFVSGLATTPRATAGGRGTAAAATPGFSAVGDGDGTAEEVPDTFTSTGGAPAGARAGEWHPTGRLEGR